MWGLVALWVSSGWLVWMNVRYADAQPWWLHWVNGVVVVLGLAVLALGMWVFRGFNEAFP